jgi:hypothetical protein
LANPVAIAWFIFPEALLACGPTRANPDRPRADRLSPDPIGWLMEFPQWIGLKGVDYLEAHGIECLTPPVDLWGLCLVGLVYPKIDDSLGQQ